MRRHANSLSTAERIAWTVTEIVQMRADKFQLLPNPWVNCLCGVETIGPNSQGFGKAPPQVNCIARHGHESPLVSFSICHFPSSEDPPPMLRQKRHLRQRSILRQPQRLPLMRAKILHNSRQPFLPPRFSLLLNPQFQQVRVDGVIGPAASRFDPHRETASNPPPEPSNR